jgi:OOP family OmpA-OmpF porin
LRVALVGHTDATGSLDANIALSRKRAASVKDRLVRAYGIAVSRLDAEGMGYLAPIASNLTQAGRDANRRVEAVLLPN